MLPFPETPIKTSDPSITESNEPAIFLGLEFSCYI